MHSVYTSYAHAKYKTIVTRLNNATTQMRYNEIFVATITGVTISFCEVEKYIVFMKKPLYTADFSIIPEDFLSLLGLLSNCYKI